MKPILLATLALSMVSAGPVRADNASGQPTTEECSQAGSYKPTADEISKMTKRQKEAAKIRLEASLQTLKKCLNAETEKFLKKATVSKEEAAQECARRGEPKIGMSAVELVETCWQKPKRILKKTTASGVEESYVYGIGKSVTLIDGKVSEILEAR